MAEDLQEVERKGQRSHKGTAPIYHYLRRRRMRAEAEDDEDD